MAKKKNESQAERIVSDAKKKTSAANSTSKAKTKKPAAKKSPAKAAARVKTEYENPIPSGVLTAIISFLLFVLFLVMSINPEGALLLVVRAVILGLVGQAGFFFAEPALFYLECFCMHHSVCFWGTFCKIIDRNTRYPCS